MSMKIADSLSRAHLTACDHLKISTLVSQGHIQMIKPCLFVFDNISVPILSRSGHVIITRQGQKPPTTCQGARNLGEPALIRPDISRIRQTGTHQSHRTRQVHNLRLPGVPGHTHPGTLHHTQQTLPHKDVHQDGRGGHKGHRPPVCQQGHRGSNEKQGLRLEDQGSHLHGSIKVGPVCYTHDTPRRGGQSSHPAHVFRGVKTVRSGTPCRQEIRPDSPPHEGGSANGTECHHIAYKVGQEYAKSGGEQDNNIAGDSKLQAVPGHSDQGSFRPHPDSLTFRPPPSVSQVKRPDPSFSHQESLGYGPERSRGRCSEALFAQPQEGGRHSGPPRRLCGPFDPETRRLEVECIPDLYYQRQSHTR